MSSVLVIMSSDRMENISKKMISHVIYPFSLSLLHIPEHKKETLPCMGETQSSAEMITSWNAGLFACPLFVSRGNGINKKNRGNQAGVGQGGGTYGNEQLSVLLLGSGGGSGGNDNALHDNPAGGYGGRGGGAIRLDAREKLIVSGAVNAQGQPGQGDSQAK